MKTNNTTSKGVSSQSKESRSSFSKAESTTGQKTVGVLEQSQSTYLKVIECIQETKSTKDSINQTQTHFDRSLKCSTKRARRAFVRGLKKLNNAHSSALKRYFHLVGFPVWILLGLAIFSISLLIQIPPQHPEATAALAISPQFLDEITSELTKLRDYKSSPEKDLITADEMIREDPREIQDSQTQIDHHQAELMTLKKSNQHLEKERSQLKHFLKTNFRITPQGSQVHTSEGWKNFQLAPIK